MNTRDRYKEVGAWKVLASKDTLIQSEDYLGHFDVLSNPVQLRAAFLQEGEEIQVWEYQTSSLRDGNMIVPVCNPCVDANPDGSQPVLALTKDVKELILQKPARYALRKTGSIKNNNHVEWRYLGVQHLVNDSGCCGDC